MPTFIQILFDFLAYQEENLETQHFGTNNSFLLLGGKTSPGMQGTKSWFLKNIFVVF